VPGYRYSAALRAQHLTWSDQTLDAWLSGPRQFIPGAAMPFRVSVPAERADLIAYPRSWCLDRDNGYWSRHPDGSWFRGSRSESTWSGNWIGRLARSDTSWLGITRLQRLYQALHRVVAGSEAKALDQIRKRSAEVLN